VFCDVGGGALEWDGTATAIVKVFWFFFAKKNILAAALSKCDGCVRSDALILLNRVDGRDKGPAKGVFCGVGGGVVG
jgi:hypothetical protein